MEKSANETTGGSPCASNAGACQLAVASGAPDRKPFGWETGAPQTGCFDDLGIRESVPGGPPEPFVTIQLTIVDVLGCWE